MQIIIIFCLANLWTEYLIYFFPGVILVGWRIQTNVFSDTVFRPSPVILSLKIV